MSRLLFLIACVLVVVLLGPLPPADAQEAAAFKTLIQPFLDTHCTACHGPGVQKAGLRLDNLKADFRDPHDMEQWIKVHDKLVAGAMPPPKRERPAKRDLDAVTAWL